MPTKSARALQKQHMPKASSKLNFELPSFTFEDESLVAGTNLPVPSRDPSPAPPAAKQQQQDAANPLRSHPMPDSSGQAAQEQGDQTQGKQDHAAGPISNGPAVVPPEHLGLNTNTAVTAVGAAPGMKRPHSVRRLLSMRSLSQTFSSHGRDNSSATAAASASPAEPGSSDFGPPRGRRTPSIFGRSSSSTWGRPESRSGASTVGSTADGASEGGRRRLKKRMSGGFWSRRSSFTMSRMMEDGIPENGVAPTPQRKKTPPPQLPDFSTLKIVKELHEEDGAFLNGDDMFKGIEYKPEI